MKNYQCNKCATLVQSSSSPNRASCPSSGSHSWTDLGKIGNTYYQCKNCRALIKSDSSPSRSSCPSSGSHSWTKL